MKTLILKFSGLVIAMFCLLFVSSCYDDELLIDPCTSSLYPKETCSGKDVLSFTDIPQLQLTYSKLESDYSATNDVKVFEDFESQRCFRSLRKNEFDKDEGIIPNTPSFEASDFTSDEVMEAILNEDAMVIINDSIYLWNDACLAYRAKFSCQNVQGLLELRDLLADFYSGNSNPDLEFEFFDIQTKYGITPVNICDNHFDFENPSDPTTGLRAKTNCGLFAFIESEILTNDPINKTATIRLTANYFSPSGEQVFPVWYLPNAGNEVKVINSSVPGWVGFFWNTLKDLANDILDVNIPAHPGKTIELEIAYQNLPQLEVLLFASLNPISGKSCFAVDEGVINLECPVNLVKKSLNISTGTWELRVEGIPLGSSFSYQWDFGDGTGATSSSTVQVHSFPVGCAPQDFNISVKIFEGLCLADLNTHVWTVNPCMLNIGRAVVKGKDNNKRYKMLLVLKPNGKLKHSYRQRVDGNKHVEVLSGDIFYGDGPSCQSVPYKSLMQDFTTSGKNKLLLTKKANGTKYKYDINAPYVVKFWHDNGLSHDLEFSDKCLTIN